jgi:hypothetical protein
MKLFKLLFLIVLWGSSLIQAQQPFDEGKAGFSVSLAGIDNHYRTLAIYVLPGETTTMRSASLREVRAEVGALKQLSPLEWQWQAPAVPGLYPLELRAANNRYMLINAFVMKPASAVKGGYLQQYRIGHYPQTPLRGLDSYLPPRGFVEVTPENFDTPVSPHFTLGQFICKQKSSGRNKYVVLRSELLLKLERILQETNARGFRSDSLFIMSGYRTPYYNRAIGNKTQYSRHVYGGAADFYIDESPRDGVMDDLNGDGRIDKRDAGLLFELVDKLSREQGWPHRGGLGEYGATASHGPFVHVDSRGYRARWGH